MGSDTAMRARSLALVAALLLAALVAVTSADPADYEDLTSASCVANLGTAAFEKLRRSYKYRIVQCSTRACASRNRNRLASLYYRRRIKLEQRLVRCDSSEH